MASFRSSFFLLLASASLAQAQLPSQPGDWPSWRGPDRNGLSKERGLLKDWPADGPTLLWKYSDLGTGFSTPSVAGGNLFVLGADEKKVESLICIDASTGQRQWATPFGATAGGYPGPRSTPTVAGNLIYVISSNGILLCADAANGEPRWTKDFKKDFGGRSGGWAYCESPLVDGRTLVCTPGGEHPIVALNLADGSVIWKSDVTGLPAVMGKKGGNYTTAGYSSVIVAEIEGVRQYIQFLSGGVIGVDARTGKLLWNYDRPANRTANISTPVLVGSNAVFAASAYGTGGGLAEISKKDDKFQAVEKYFLNEMQNHHGGMILLDGFLYGTNGSKLLCVNIETGKIAWENKSVGKGSIAFADGHLYVRSESGPVALVEVNPQSYVEKGRFAQPERAKDRAWAHPVVAGGKLFLRDQGILLCYQVSAR